MIHCSCFIDGNATWESLTLRNWNRYLARQLRIRLLSVWLGQHEESIWIIQYFLMNGICRKSWINSEIITMNVACIRLSDLIRQKRKQRSLLPIEQLFHLRITDGNHIAKGCTNYRSQRKSVIRTGQATLRSLVHRTHPFILPLRIGWFCKYLSALGDINQFWKNVNGRAPPRPLSEGKQNIGVSELPHHQ